MVVSMNKAFILLLVTLVQSQTDGVLLLDPSTGDPFRDSLAEDPESPYPMDLSGDFDHNSQPHSKRSVTSDAFTRRSSLDKNFMRFGRGDDGFQKLCERGPSGGKLNFYRFGRGLKDNFIRFGRARNDFIRFGRGGGKDGFIRFGRDRTKDFFRPSKSLRENFMRFGRAKGDENSLGSEEKLERAGKSSRAQENFMRFGRNGKNGTNFLRFGKSEGGERGEDSGEEEGEKRRRREAKSKRPTGFFPNFSTEYFPRRFASVLGGSSRNAESLNESRLTPFFTVFPTFSRSSDPSGSEEKRNQGGSNFIRFG